MPSDFSASSRKDARRSWWAVLSNSSVLAAILSASIASGSAGGFAIIRAFFPMQTPPRQEREANWRRIQQTWGLWVTETPFHARHLILLADTDNRVSIQQEWPLAEVIHFWDGRKVDVGYVVDILDPVREADRPFVVMTGTLMRPSELAEVYDREGFVGVILAPVHTFEDGDIVFLAATFEEPLGANRSRAFDSIRWAAGEMGRLF